MSFTNPTGTHGSRQPRGRIVEFFGHRMAGRLRRKGGGKAAGLDALVLTTIGARSGQTRETVVARFPAEGGGWLVVASANGAAHNPSWYHNIAAHPDQVAGYDPARPALSQIDKLSDAQIRAVAASLDPWAKPGA